jgi:hypothetical protein
MLILFSLAFVVTEFVWFHSSQNNRNAEQESRSFQAPHGVMMMNLTNNTITTITTATATTTATSPTRREEEESIDSTISRLPKEEEEQDHNEKNGMDLSSPQQQQQQQLVNTDPKDIRIRYVGFAGLGHRLMRMSNAYHLAKALNISLLEPVWKGYCPRGKGPSPTTKQPNVFSYLFGNEPLVVPPSLLQQPLLPFSVTQAIHDMKSRRQQVIIKFRNDVKGYTHMYGARDIQNMMRRRQQDPAASTRNTTTDTTLLAAATIPPFYGKLESDYEMYSQLLKRFRFRNEAQQLMAAYYSNNNNSSNTNNYTVLGLHIRAGNGEQGDFEKYRQLGRDGGGGLDGWLSNVTNMLQNYLLLHHHQPQGPTTKASPSASNNRQSLSALRKPIMIFLATDTPLVIDKFKEVFSFSNHNDTTMISTSSSPPIVLVVAPQQRPAFGEGVSYEAKNQVDVTSCLESWKSQFMDMMILSEYSDLLIAGQYSSFTQTIPASVIFHKADAKAAAAASSSSRQASPSNGAATTTPLFCDIGMDGDVMRCCDTFTSWITQNSTLPLIGNNLGRMEFSKSEVMFPVELTKDTLQKLLKKQ